MSGCVTRATLAAVDSTTAGLAAYERVAESIRADIRSGTLRPGDKLPGNRDVATKYEVALGTAQKALRVLQDEGWLTSRPTVGVFVNEPPDETTAAPTLEAVSREVAELRATVAGLAQRVDKIEGGQAG